MLSQATPRQTLRCHFGYNACNKLSRKQTDGQKDEIRIQDVHIPQMQNDIRAELVIGPTEDKQLRLCC